MTYKSVFKFLTFLISVDAEQISQKGKTSLMKLNPDLIIL